MRMGEQVVNMRTSGERFYGMDITDTERNGSLGFQSDIEPDPGRKAMVYAPSFETRNDIPKRLQFVKEPYSSIAFKNIWKGLRMGKPRKGMSSAIKKMVVKYFFDNSDVGASIAADPGGYKALHLLYLNDPCSYLDKWVHNRRASKGTKERQKEYKRLLKESILEAYGNGKVNIIDLFSGPALGPQEVIEELAESGADLKRFELTAVDKNPKSLELGKKIAQEKGLTETVKFKNYDVRAVSEKEDNSYFHVAGTHGGNDYLSDEKLIKLLKDTGKVLATDGRIVTTNMIHHDDNFTRFLMENYGGWKIIYRSPREFEQSIRNSNVFDIENSCIVTDTDSIKFSGGIPEDIDEPKGFHILIKGRKNHI